MTPTAIEEAKAVSPKPTAAAKYQLLPIAKIKESETNPRKHFDAEALKELAGSIKEFGVLEPIIVRPDPRVTGWHELVAGARRLRAAKLAGLEEIPAVVRTFNDVQAIEAQIIENLQRQDVSPIDEANGYRQLLKHGYTVEMLAQKISKSVRYVYNRLELQKLAPPVRTALEKGEITASHAQLIGQLDRESDQVKMLKDCHIQEWGYGSGDDQLLLGDGDTRKKRGLIGVRDLEQRVSAAKLGADLIKKRDEIRQTKIKLGPKNEVSQAAHLITAEYGGGRDVLGRNDWKATGKTVCPKSGAQGIFIDKAKRGQVINICAGIIQGGERCTTHFKPTPSGSAYGHSPKRTAAEEKKRQAELLKERIVNRQRQLLHYAVVEKIGKMTRADLELIVKWFADHIPDGDPRLRSLFPRKGYYVDVAGCSDVQLFQLLVSAALEDELSTYQDGKRLMATAKRLKVEISKLESSGAGEVKRAAAHKERVRKWKGRVASEKTSFDEPTCTGCGCTETTACPTADPKKGCSWAKLNPKSNAGVCSACAEAADSE